MNFSNTAKAALVSFKPYGPPRFANTHIGCFVIKPCYKIAIAVSRFFYEFDESIIPVKRVSEASRTTSSSFFVANSYSCISFVILNEPSICFLVSTESDGMKRGSTPPYKMLSLLRFFLSSVSSLFSWTKR